MRKETIILIGTILFMGCTSNNTGRLQEWERDPVVVNILQTRTESAERALQTSQELMRQNEIRYKEATNKVAILEMKLGDLEGQYKRIKGELERGSGIHVTDIHGMWDAIYIRLKNPNGSFRLIPFRNGMTNGESFFIGPNDERYEELPTLNQLER